FYLAHKIRAYAVWIAIFFLGLAALFRSGNRSAAGLLGVITGALLLEVLLLSQTNYQLHPLLTLVIVASSAGWALLWNEYTSRAWRISIAALAIIGFLLPAVRHNAFGFQDMSEEDMLVRYLRSRIPPGSILQTAGSMHAPLALAVNPASRFIMLHELVQRDRFGNLQDFQISWRNEYLRDLIKNRPLYFLMHDGYDGERQFLNGETPWEVIGRDLPAVGNWLDRTCHIETRIGRYTLYRRNSE